MKCFNITLDTVEKVKEFSNLINKFDGEFDLISDNYIIDAKSIMGIFSLDLKKPLKAPTIPNINIITISKISIVIPYIHIL